MVHHLKEITFPRALIFSIFFFLPLTTAPLFYDPYTTIKWKFVHLFGIFATGFLFFKKSPLKLPPFSKPLSMFFLLIIGHWGWEIYYHNLPVISYVVLERFLFIGLVLFFFHQFKEDPKTLPLIQWTLLLSALVFSLFMVKSLQISSIGEFFTPKAYKKHVAFTFNNENMAAQYFGILVLLSLWATYKAKIAWFKILLGLFSLWLSILLGKMGCRSALLGIICALCTYGLFCLSKHQAKRMVLACMALGILVGSAFIFFRPITARHRTEMWSNALHISKDYPLGIGRGKYQFYQVLYQSKDQIYPANERLIELTPHSEPLKYLSEQGWIFALILLCFFGLFIKGFGKPILDQSFQSRKTRFMMSSMAFFIPEILVQFPFELPFPFLMFTVFGGFLLSLTEGRKNLPLPKAAGVIPLMFLTLSAAFIFIGDLGNGRHRYNPHMIKLGCELSPYDWRTCANHIKFLSSMSQSKNARNIALKQLEIRPFFFHALLYVAKSEYLLDNIHIGCRTAWFYDRLFLYKSKLSKLVRKSCTPKDDTILQKTFQQPIQEHYKTLFDHLSEKQKRNLTRNV